MPKFFLHSTDGDNEDAMDDPWLLFVISCWYCYCER